MDSLGYMEASAGPGAGNARKAAAGRDRRLASDHPARLIFNEARREVSHAGGRAYRLLRVIHRTHRLLTADSAAYAALLRERRVEPRHRNAGEAGRYLPTTRLLLGATKSDQTKLRYAQALALADREGAGDAAAFVRRQGGLTAACRRWREIDAAAAPLPGQAVLDGVAQLLDERPEIGGRVEGEAPADAPRGLVLMVGHVDACGQAKVLKVLPDGKAVIERLLARRLGNAGPSRALAAAAAEGRDVADEQTQHGLPEMMAQAVQVLALLGLAEWATPAQAADVPEWRDVSANFDWSLLATLDPPPLVATPAEVPPPVDLAGQPGPELPDELFSFDY